MEFKATKAWYEPYTEREKNDWTVGVSAFTSPILSHTDILDSMTSSGLIGKFPDFQRMKSAEGPGAM